MLVEARRCPSCGGRAELEGITEHHADVDAYHVVPLGQVQQGGVLRYACACGARFSLLDRLRKAWFGYSVVAGAAIGLAGGFLGESAALAILGALVALGFAGVLARDAWIAAKHPPV